MIVLRMQVRLILKEGYETLNTQGGSQMALVSLILSASA